mgnify:FL=1
MSKTLELIFKTNLNKTAKLQLPQISATITEANVQSAMENIIKLNVLSFNSGVPSKAASAQIVDKTTTVLFELN